MEVMDFSGRVVLVTGASRGIGEAIATQFAERGARVAVHYHQNRKLAQHTVNHLAGDRHMIVQADVKDPAAVAGMVEQVVEQMGRLDILVNNAGIFEEHPLADTSYAAWQASWRRVLDTNLVGAANVSYCAARQMIVQGGGRIVNVSSRGAFPALLAP